MQDIITDFDIWAKDREAYHAKSFQETGVYNHFDKMGAKRLSTIFKGYMISPVAQDNGVMLEAKSRAINFGSSFNIIKEELLKQSPTLYLYDFIWTPITPQWSVLEGENFTLRFLDEPVVQQNPFWKIRYAAV